MSQKKRFALVGTGSRAGMYIDALTTTYAESNEMVALCDQSQTRMDWYNTHLTARQLPALPPPHRSTG